MNSSPLIYLFGEVLFDCFPSGEKVLGGAPFNVAWHLQALGHQPKLISRIGNDEEGRQILSKMKGWGMDVDFVQHDKQYSTGRVQISLLEGEPTFEIESECAYDFIQVPERLNSSQNGIIYHGSLGLRHEIACHTLQHILNETHMSVFLDVNLRKPWWNKEQVVELLKLARWVKMNQEELNQLGFSTKNIAAGMGVIQAQFGLDMLIVTLGERGAYIIDREGSIFQDEPLINGAIVDTVGAGDAFSAIVMHGIAAGWSGQKILTNALKFASHTVLHRGALIKNLKDYQAYLS